MSDLYIVLSCVVLCRNEARMPPISLLSVTSSALLEGTVPGGAAHNGSYSSGSILFVQLVEPCWRPHAQERNADKSSKNRCHVLETQGMQAVARDSRSTQFEGAFQFALSSSQETVSVGARYQIWHLLSEGLHRYHLKTTESSPHSQYSSPQ